MMRTESITLDVRQQRYVKLLFKFRFVSAQYLSMVLGISRVSAYQALEHLVGLGLVVKVYEASWRIERKPAYYYLSNSGISIVRKLLGVKEPVVHALYKNSEVSAEFVNHCLDVLGAYPFIKKNLSDNADLFAKAELARFPEPADFPRNRPDLYARTPDGREAFIVFLHDCPPYVARRRMDELITHCDEEGWDGSYPLIAFVCKDKGAKLRLLGRAARKLDNLYLDEEDIRIVAATLSDIKSSNEVVWSSVFSPRKLIPLFE